jgi:hypothetical protein
MRRLTPEVWEELVQKPIKSLKDVELAQLRRSNRSGSYLRSRVIGEQLRRGLLDPGTRKELIKNLSDYSDREPVQHDTELDDFHMSLESLQQHINHLIEQHGPQAQIFVDAGPNNVCVIVETYPAISSLREQREQNG